ncbi:MAG: four helix bundle protein [Planctomycetota bacterium]
MSITGRPRDIEERTFRFGVRVVRAAGALPRTAAGAVLARQVIRSGTSVGANIQEAQGSPSKRDFVWRMNIARSEARETLYWIRLISESEMIPKARLKELESEANQIVSILTAIVKKSRSSEVRGKRESVGG